MTRIVSPIKWTGSKSHLAPKLSKLFPENYSKVIDPFVGGGNLLPYYKAPCQASDICQVLIDLWTLIRDCPGMVIKDYTHHHEAFKEKGYEYYYEIRKWFNEDKDPTDFLFLNRTCVNGAIRFNSKGEFNSSVHLNRWGMEPDTLLSLFYKWSPILSNTEFSCRDYKEALKKAGEDTFVFLDPPYYNSLGKMYETSNNFDHIEMVSWLDTLNGRGVKWMLTSDASSNLENQLKLVAHNKTLLDSGNSPFLKYSGKIKKVQEAVYRNYE